MTYTFWLGEEGERNADVQTLYTWVNVDIGSARKQWRSLSGMVSFTHDCRVGNGCEFDAQRVSRAEKGDGDAPRAPHTHGR